VKLRIISQREVKFLQKTSKALQSFLVGVKWELIGTQLIKTECNIPKGEVEVLKKTWLKCKEIVIKPCDKGAGILIMSFMSGIVITIFKVNQKMTRFIIKIQTKNYTNQKTN
jgi:hypothetical protein